MVVGARAPVVAAPCAGVRDRRQRTGRGQHPFAAPGLGVGHHLPRRHRAGDRDARASCRAKPATLVFQGVVDSLLPRSAVMGGAGRPLAETDFRFDRLTPASLLQRSAGKVVTLVRTAPRSGTVTRLEATVESADRRRGAALGPRAMKPCSVRDCRSGWSSRKSPAGSPPHPRCRCSWALAPPAPAWSPSATCARLLLERRLCRAPEPGLHAHGPGRLGHAAQRHEFEFQAGAGTGGRRQAQPSGRRRGWQPARLHCSGSIPTNSTRDRPRRSASPTCCARKRDGRRRTGRPAARLLPAGQVHRWPADRRPPGAFTASDQFADRPSPARNSDEVQVTGSRILSREQLGDYQLPPALARRP